MKPHSMFHDRPPRRHQEKPALFHGLDERDQLISVDDLEEGGKTDLRCPYCKGLLTAKKGEVVTHHFAHSIGKQECETFASHAPRIRLPLYDSFDWGISPTAVRYLIRYLARWENEDWDFPERKAKQSMMGAGLMEYNSYRGNTELTKTGKMVAGKLSLKLFCQMQEPLLLDRLAELTKEAKRGGELEAVDLALYRARLLRAYTAPLVLSLAIGADGEPVPGFYRIGTDAEVPNVVKLLPHRAHLLTYFQHRYADDLAALPGEKALASTNASHFRAYQFVGEGYEDTYLPSVLRDLANVPKRSRIPDELKL